jgi:hypothetical protein
VAKPTLRRHFLFRQSSLPKTLDPDVDDRVREGTTRRIFRQPEIRLSAQQPLSTLLRFLLPAKREQTSRQRADIE